MKIELRRFESSERFSEETLAFAADVYIDGTKTFAAHNDGHGGCTTVAPLIGKREDDFAVSNLKAFATTLGMNADDCEGGDGLLTNIIDHVANEIHESKALRRQVSGWVKRHTTFIAIDKTIHTMKGKPDPRHAAYIAGKYPGALILNTIPLEEAVALVKAVQP